MISRATAGFWRRYEHLPPPIRRQAKAAFKRFMQNPQHPGLRFKQVHASEPVYAARISRDYRALAVREPDVWLWFWIGSHKDYEKLLRDL